MGFFSCKYVNSGISGGEVKFPRAPPGCTPALSVFFLCLHPAEAQSLFHGFQHQTDALAAMSGAREPGGESVSSVQKGRAWLFCAASRLMAVFADRNTDQWPQKLIMQLIPQQLLVRLLWNLPKCDWCLWTLCHSCVCFVFRPL